MERKTAILLLIVLGGGAYAGHANWGTISTKLGLADFGPAHLQAIELAKKSNDLDRYRSNSDVLTARQKSGEIEVQGDPWQAVRIDERRFLVMFTCVESGSVRRYEFRVDQGTRTVELAPESPQPAPR